MSLITLFLGTLFFNLGSFEPIRESERHQVVIVGAGVSGISAAVTLLEHNVTDIILLEASDRIGGRIHTVDFGGVTIDKGAEFVHGERKNAVYEMVNSYDLLISADKTFFQSEKMYFTNTAGDSFNSSLINDLVDKASDIMENANVESLNTTFEQYFNMKMDELFRDKNVDEKLGEGLRHHISMRLCIYNGNGKLSELGPSADYETAEGDQSLKWKPGSGGYKKLFEFLMKKFPNPSEELPVMNKIILGKEATEIKYAEGKPVEVQCADGSSYLADHVLVTVSLGVLKKHADTMFHPALPERKTAAIKALGFGSVGKVFLLFSARWWPENLSSVVPLLSNQEQEDVKKNTVHGNWMVNAQGFFPVLANDRMLVVWYFGDSCHTMESLTEDQVIEGIHEYMNMTLGKSFNVSKPEKILRTSWASNPFTQGSYSFHSVESDKQNLKNTDLAVPLMDNNKPVVLFAGEATHSHFYSTVHGALETGRREAKNIIEFHKTQSDS